MHKFLYGIVTCITLKMRESNSTYFKLAKPTTSYPGQVSNVPRTQTQTKQHRSRRNCHLKPRGRLSVQKRVCETDMSRGIVHT